MTATRGHLPVVVGVDGSHTAGPALRWAIREASTRGIPLRLVSAWNPTFDIDTLGLAARTVEDHCRVILDAAQDEVAAAGELLCNGVPAARITEQIGQASEGLDSVPLCAETLAAAGIEAPALGGLAALIEGRIDARAWVSTLRRAESSRRAA